ncbi:MAG: kynureninase [Cyclobacteriaceae bacterium]|jgi:kynureninase
MANISKADYAKSMDHDDTLSHFRSKFHIPKRNNRESIYLCGNSLGLQPKNVVAHLNIELDSWRENGVEGHFSGINPWVGYHTRTKKVLSNILGARENEVVSMNNLTTNLHLMLASFYHPKGKRTKILIEGGAFPSDHYAAESHIQRLGLNAKDHLVTMKPSSGDIFKTNEIIERIHALGDELALVLWPGIQYYSGQFFNIKTISKAAHEVGAFIGFDLAHAIGNLPMHLHDDDADFAAWCSYKYLNSGPGGIAGVFVHEKHSSNPNFPKLTGWWGHELKTRFKMDNMFVPADGVDSWMLSNMNILSMAVQCGSLELFEEAGIENLRNKSIRLTNYLETLLLKDEIINNRIRIISPPKHDERGCQLSIYLIQDGKEIFDQLIEKGVILDWREPNVIRIAPTPLYNTFMDVWEFHSILRSIFLK